MNALDSVRSKSLQPLVMAFLENVERTSSSAMTPAKIAWQVRRDQLLCDCAMFRATGKLEPDLLRLEKETEGTDEYRKELRKLVQEFFTSLTPKTEERFLDRYGVGYIKRTPKRGRGDAAVDRCLACIDYN